MIRPWNEWLIVWGYDISQPPPEVDEEKATRSSATCVGVPDLEVEITGTSLWGNNETVRHPPAEAAGLLRRATRSTGTRRRTGSAPTPASRTPTTWPGSSRRCCADQAGPALLETYSAERAPVARQIVTRANKSSREFVQFFEVLGLTDGRDRGGDAGADRGAQGQHAARRGQAGRARRGDGAEELRVQRARRRARPVLRVDGDPGRRQRPGPRPPATPSCTTRRPPCRARTCRTPGSADARAQGLHPRPGPVRRVHADHRHHRRAVGGGRREGRATTWASRSRR